LMLAITALITEFGRFMTENRNAEELVAATRRWGGRHGRTVSLIMMPAMIGLIPMPAGALFSAPFVEHAGRGMDKKAEWKSAVNYWFRHVLEFWWPLYPGAIIAMSLFEMDAWKFMTTQIFYTPVALLASYGFLVRSHWRSLVDEGVPPAGSNRRALFILLPLVIVMLALFLVPAVVDRLLPHAEAASRRMMAVLIGLLAGLVLIVADDLRRGEVRIFSSLLERRSVNVLITLAAVLIFKSLLQRSGLLPLAGRELLAIGIPIVLAVALLPFLAGLLTGIALGFTGVSFPLVVGLLASEEAGLTPSATLALAYGFGYVGMMLSPMHLCLLVTKDYFSADLRRIYRAILPCVGVVAAFSVVLYTALRLLGL